MGWSVEKASTQDDLVSLRKSRPILREKCYISHRGPSLAPSGRFTRRTCGYLGENYWNVGKTKEIKSRVLHL